MDQEYVETYKDIICTDPGVAEVHIKATMYILQAMVNLEESGTAPIKHREWNDLVKTRAELCKQANPQVVIDSGNINISKRKLLELKNYLNSVEETVDAQLKKIL